MTVVSALGACGCTNVRVTPARLSPGVSARVDVEFSSSGYAGTVDKNVTLWLDRPQGACAIVPFRAHVAFVSHLEQSDISLGTFIYGGELPSAEVTVVAAGSAKEHVPVVAIDDDDWRVAGGPPV